MMRGISVLQGIPHINTVTSVPKHQYYSSNNIMYKAAHHSNVCMQWTLCYIVTQKQASILSHAYLGNELACAAHPMGVLPWMAYYRK